ncbi:M48 family metalloprotease [bacterium]|nr:M48 family metalloprotease [bacterium]
MNQERAKLAERYERFQNVFFLLDYLVLGLFLFVLLLGGGKSLSLFVWHKVSEFTGANFWTSTLLFIFLVQLLYQVITFPYTCVKDFGLEKKFDLSNQSFFGWLWDYLKSTILMTLLLLVALLFCYAMMRYLGEWWFLAAAAGWIILQVVLGMLFPVVILPLFYKSEEINEHPCKERLIKMLESNGLKVTGLYRLDLSEKTKKANAMLCGLGATRRVMMSDALLEYPEDEIIAIMAHEVGHYKRRHIWKLAALHAALIMLGLFLLSKVLALYCARAGLNFYDAGSYPVFLLFFSLWQLLTMPVTNGFSRKCETEADIFALQSTGLGSAFASALLRLADGNLAVLDVPRAIEIFLYSHPATGKRIRMAQNWEGKS